MSKVEIEMAELKKDLKYLIEKVDNIHEELACHIREQKVSDERLTKIETTKADKEEVASMKIYLAKMAGVFSVIMIVVSAIVTRIIAKLFV